MKYFLQINDCQFGNFGKLREIVKIKNGHNEIDQFQQFFQVLLFSIEFLVM